MASGGAATSLRGAHVETTRRMILDATTELLVEANPATLSMADVAARAGVSERTVYRHFPTKDALFRAAVTQSSRGTEEWVATQVLAEVEPEALLAHLWTELAEQLTTIRAQLATPEGRALRAVRLEGRHEWLRERLEVEGIDTASAEGERLLHLVSVLVASTTLIEFNETLGLDAEQAAAEAGWAIRTLIDATRHTTQGEPRDTA